MIKTIKKLEEYIQSVPGRFLGMEEDIVLEKPHPEKWCKKEIMGHLVDSAMNNIQRVIRVQYDPGVRIVYDQEKWVALQDYQHLDTKELVELWVLLNRQFIRILKRFPEEKLTAQIDTGKTDQELHDAAFIIEDYVDHMEHHLSQIFGSVK